MSRSFQKILFVLVLFVVPLTSRSDHPQEIAKPMPSGTGTAEKLPPGMDRSDWEGILTAHEEWKHTIREAPDGGEGWQAENPGTGLRATFDGRGGEVRTEAEDWRWGLELQGYGVGAERRPLAEQTPRVEATGRRIGYDWDGNLEEWYQNKAQGLEHGYTIQKRPGRPGENAPLELWLQVRGELTAVEIDANGRGASFGRQQGDALLRYAGLKVWDGNGQEVAARLRTAGHGDLQLVVDDQLAVYPLTIDPTISQRAYLKGLQLERGMWSHGDWKIRNRFGRSVAISGETVVVGSATGTHVFVRTKVKGPGEWVQQATISNQLLRDLIVSPYGQETITTSVAISGETLVILASTIYYHYDLAVFYGFTIDAFVFVRNGTTWEPQGVLSYGGFSSPGSPYDESGFLIDDGFYRSSVAISGDTVVIGIEQWRASVYVRNGTTWSQQAYLLASNKEELTNELEDNDRFGHSVAISGETIVVGAPGESSNASGVNSDETDNSAPGAGAAYVFVRNGTTWSQQAYLKASNTEAGDQFGASVAITGETIVVGALGEDSNATGVNGDETDNRAENAGAAYVFLRNGTTWSQQAYLKASNTDLYDQLGTSVAISGETVVIGAPGESSNASEASGDQANNSSPGAGAAYVFVRKGTTWRQLAYHKASNRDAGDEFGSAVAISGEMVVIGAPGEDSNATEVDGDQSDNRAENAGAAYVYRVSETTIPTITVPGAVTRQQGAPSSSSIIATVSDVETPAGNLLVTVDGSGTATIDGVTISNVVNQNGTIYADIVAAPDALVGSKTFYLIVDDGTSVDFTPLEVIVVRVMGESASISLQNGALIGPGSILTIRQTLINNLAIAASTNFVATLPLGLSPLTCTSPIGNCTFGTSLGMVGGGVEWQRQSGASSLAGGQTVNWTGILPPLSGVTITYQVRVDGRVANGTRFCIATAIGGGAGPTSCLTINHGLAGPTAGPGSLPLPMGLPNQQKPGSVLIFNVYTSSINTVKSDTLISLTNTHPSEPVNAHLFFVDGASCSVADQVLTLTQNQTVSFLASDIDPGITGYLLVVAVGANGCPTMANFLIGTEAVRFESGHHAVLPAMGISARGGGGPCQGENLTASIAFDGVAYDELPRGVALATLPSLEGGNSPLLVVNRLGGNLMSGAERLGFLTGLLFDDREVARSFNLPGGLCQLRGMVGNNFPRTVPRYTTVIPAGRTGWMKFWAVEDEAISGVLINEALSGLSGGYNLQTMTTTSTATLTIPVLPVR